jgi:hypothetical protein
MSRTRPDPRRRRFPGVAPILLALGALPLLAPTCGDPGEGFKTFARNSLIIPMDVCYQRQTDSTGTNYQPSPGCPQTPDAGDVIKAYGLVYELIRNDIAVYWVIENTKTTIDGVDLSVQYLAGAPVYYYDWTPEDPPPTPDRPTTQNIIHYRGGPFVVDGSDFARASAVLQSFRSTFQNVNVHFSDVAFRGYAKRTMAGGWSAGGTVPPKVALLDIGSTSSVSGGYSKNSEPIIRGYLAKAGLDFPGAGGVATDTGHGQIYDRLGMADLQPTTPDDWTTTNLYRYGYQILWVPHWFAPGSCANATSQSACVGSLYTATQTNNALETIGSFVGAGKDLFAECAGLGSFDGVASGASGWSSSYQDGCPGDTSCSPTTHFHATNGLAINKNVAAVSYDTTSASSPLLQLGDYPFIARTGAIQNFKPATGRTPASTYQSGVARLVSDSVDPTFDYFTYRPPTTGRGTTVYLGGHSYSGFSDTLGQGGTLQPDSSFGIGGTRLVLNTLFNLGATCTASGVACNTGQPGICAAGTIICQGGQPVCSQTNTPTGEVCNGLDDNCNWEVDEGLQTSCYDGPGGTENVGLCRAGVRSCVQAGDGSWGMGACAGQVLPAAETCNGLDDDCDGLVDEGLQETCYEGPTSSLDPSTGQPRGECRPGTRTCSNGSWGACAGQVLPKPEVCSETPGNEKDDDCNGVVNDGCGCTDGATLSCYTGPGGTNGVGVCHGGTQTCSGNTWGPCVGEVVPAAEVCGNGVDEDCRLGDAVCPGCVDPVTSLTHPVGPAPVACVTVPLAQRNVGQCKDGSMTCVANGVWSACAGEILPSPFEACDGIDNDCDGTSDESAICPANFTCLAGVCVPDACGVEVPPPEGYVCNPTGDPNGVVEPGNCGGGGPCAAGEVCRFGQCVPPCAPDQCAPGSVCGGGACIAGACYAAGCNDEVVLASPTASATGGTLATGTYYYRVTAVGAPGESLPSNERSVSVTGPTASVSLSWNAFPGATGYRVYRGTAPFGEDAYQASATPTFTDTGAAGTAGSPPATSGFPRQLCRNGECVPDPCQGVVCPSGTFCREGDCVQACAFVSCFEGERCGVDGFCEPDPCASITCGAGQRCTNGGCATDPCLNRGCATGQICTVDGSGAALCVDDPCVGISCPTGACTAGQCYSTANPTGRGTASRGGAPGEGGCGCGSGGAAALPALLALLAAPLARRRRRPRDGGRSGLASRLALLLTASALLGSACKKDKEFNPADCQETCGEERCVDLAFDAAHCSACSAACGTGEICVDAVCGPASAVAPYIVAVSPSSGPPGSAVPVTVQVTGERFTSGATLRVMTNTTTLAVPTSFTDSGHLSADLDLSGAAASEWRLRVVNPDKVISNSVAFDVVVPSPFLVGVQGAVTAGQTATVLLTGTGFIATTQAHLRSVDGSVPDFGLPSTVDAQGVHATIDASSLPPGAYEIWVVNEGTLASNVLTLVVSSDVAELLDVSPTSGEANAFVTLTLTGTGFDLSSKVLFDGCAGPNDPVPACGAAVPTVGTSFVDSTRLTASLTLSAASGPHGIAVRNGSGGTTGTLTFTIATNQPSVTTFSPSTAYQGETVTLTFQGTNFGASATIEVQPPGGPFAAISTGAVTGCPSCSVSGTLNLAGQPEGSWLARVNFGGGIISGAWPLRVLSNQAILQDMSPRSGPQGSTTPVTLQGANLRQPYAGIRVRFTSATVSQELDPPDPAAATAPLTVTPNLTGLDTGTYAFTIVNAGATPSNALSFAVTPGPPTVTSVCRLEGGSCAATNPTSANQGPSPVPVRIAGTNFAKPDASGNGSAVMVTANILPGWPDPCPASGTPPFQPVPGTVTVVSPTEIVVALDTLSALANTTYYVAVWNPGGSPPPQKSNTCATLPGALPGFTILP